MNQLNFPSIIWTKDCTTSILWQADPSYPFSVDDIFNVRSSKFCKLDSISNKLIIELGLTARGLKNLNYSILYIDENKNETVCVRSVGGMLKCWLSLLGDDGKKSDYSYECKFKAMEKEYKRLEKNCRARKDRGGYSSFKALSDYLTSEFQWSPKCVCFKKSKPTAQSQFEDANTSSFKSSEICDKTRNTCTDSYSAGRTIGALLRENKKHKIKNSKLKTELDELKSVVGKRSRDILNTMHDMEKSAKEEISDLESKLEKSKEKLRNTVPLEKFQMTEKKLKEGICENKLLKKELVRATVQVESSEDKISELTLKLKNEQTKRKSKSRQVKRCHERIESLKSKVTECKNQSRIDKEAVSLYYKGIIEELDKQIEQGNASVEEKEKTIESMKNMDTKHKGIYNSEIRLLYYDLLTKGVPSNIVQDVVRTVLDSTYLEASNLSLPSRSTAQRMLAEAGHLCTIRLAVEKAKSGSKLAHQSDGTTKVQVHWLSHVLKLSNGEGKNKSFTLSVSPVTSSAAQETLDDLKNHLQKLEDIAKKLGIVYKDGEYKISEIIARMSDRANTEKAVTRLMMEEKERELEKSADWTKISDEERQERIRIYAFTCGNHKINNTAEAMTKVSAEFLYQGQGENDSRKMKGAKQHIYECDKLLCQTSKKEYAKGVDFKCFSISSNEDTGSDLFKPIVGSRYLVYLYNAIPTVVGRKSIISFLETVRDSKDVPTFNKIEQSVFSGYFDEKIVSEECAFAIMYHEICHPLMVKVKSAVSPLSLNPYYEYAINKMREWGNDASGLLNGDGWEGPEGGHNHEGTLQNYMEKVREISRKPAYMGTVQQILQVMCKAGANKLSSHASEHLDGGAYFRPTVSAKQAGLKIGEAHNDKLESKFGMLDRRLEFAPSSNFHNVGSFIKAKTDKPHLWLKEQTLELREAAVSWQGWKGLGN